MAVLASNPGFPFRILSRSFVEKSARQNPERKAWVRGYGSASDTLGADQNGRRGLCERALSTHA